VIRTFLDSGILISAARGDRPHSERCQRIIEERRRTLLTSVFVRLEVYPQVTYREFALQRAYLNEFFMEPALEWASDLNGMVQLGLLQAERHGLGAMDSLHIAAAMLLRADQFITAEKPSKPMFRVQSLSVINVDNPVLL
jgi:predicted nucleic acid-binding protein